MDVHDPLPRRTAADVKAALDRGMADVAAGRVVPGETVLAELDAAIAEMERRQAAKATDAA